MASKKKVVGKKQPAKIVKKIAKAKPTKKTAPKTKKPKVAASAHGIFTTEQWTKFQEHKNELKEKSNQDLKEMLKKNLQSMTGTKDEMIQKICEGRILGQIPRCPSCFGGRPKFNYKTGKYDCPGYRDDTDFKNCHKTFSFADILRASWVD